MRVSLLSLVLYLTSRWFCGRKCRISWAIYVKFDRGNIRIMPLTSEWRTLLRTAFKQHWHRTKNMNDVVYQRVWCWFLGCGCGVVSVFVLVGCDPASLDNWFPFRNDCIVWKCGRPNAQWRGVRSKYRRDLNAYVTGCVHVTMDIRWEAALMFLTMR